jgi:hypothetical protein
MHFFRFLSLIRRIEARISKSNRCTCDIHSFVVVIVLIFAKVKHVQEKNNVIDTENVKKINSEKETAASRMNHLISMSAGRLV